MGARPEGQHAWGSIRESPMYGAPYMDGPIFKNCASRCASKPLKDPTSFVNVDSVKG